MRDSCLTLIVACLLAAPIVASAEVNSAAAHLWYEEQVPPSAPVVAEFVYRNQEGAQCVLLLDYSSDEGIAIRYNSPSGAEVEVIPGVDTARSGFRMGDRLPLAQGQTIEFSVLLSEHVPFSETGDYEVVITVRTECDQVVRPVSAHVKVSIERLAEHSLDDLCTVFMEKAVSAPVQQATVGARALSAVSGPICKLELLEALESRPVGLSFIIERLLEFEDAETRESVAQTWRSLSVFERSQVLGELESSSARDTLLSFESHDDK